MADTKPVMYISRVIYKMRSAYLSFQWILSCCNRNSMALLKMLCPSTGCGKFMMAATANLEVVQSQLPGRIAMPFQRQTPHPHFLVLEFNGADPYTVRHNWTSDHSSSMCGPFSTNATQTDLAKHKRTFFRSSGHFGITSVINPLLPTGGASRPPPPNVFSG